MKAGYLTRTGANSKTIRIQGNKTVRFDIYSAERMKELNVPAIIEPDFMEDNEAGSKVVGIF